MGVELEDVTWVVVAIEVAGGERERLNIESTVCRLSRARYPAGCFFKLDRRARGK